MKDSYKIQNEHKFLFELQRSQQILTDFNITIAAFSKLMNPSGVNVRDWQISLSYKKIFQFNPQNKWYQRFKRRSWRQNEVMFQIRKYGFEVIWEIFRKAIQQFQISADQSRSQDFGLCTFFKIGQLIEYKSNNEAASAVPLHDSRPNSPAK